MDKAKIRILVLALVLPLYAVPAYFWYSTHSI